MNTVSWIAFRDLLEKNNAEKKAMLMRYLSDKEKENLVAVPLPSANPFSYNITIKERISSVHYSWLIPFIEPFSEKDKIKIGGTTTVTEIMNSSVIKKYLPEIIVCFKLFGSLPIRNRATLAGNIINASPIADMTNFFLALNSIITLNNGKKKRELFLKDFYKGYKTLDKKRDEILESLSFRIPPGNSLFNYEKVSRRTYLDIASVNSSMYMELKDNKIIVAHISAGGVAPIPLYLNKTSNYLKEKEVSETMVNEAIGIMLTEITPISDARGTVEYKTLLLRQLIYSHFMKFFPDLISVEEIV